MAIIVIRTLIIYFLLLITMRLLGKRQLGEMELSEFVLAALSADLAANPLQDLGVPMINGIVPILVLFCAEIIISGISVKNIKLRSLLFGRPSLLIKKGMIDHKEMDKNRISPDELMQELRNQSILDIALVEYAVLETDGKLNVFPYALHSPPNCFQMGIPADDRGYTSIIVSDGRILSENLRLMGLDENWLHRQLSSNNVNDISRVFLMTADQTGKVYLSVRGEKNEA